MKRNSDRYNSTAELIALLAWGVGVLMIIGGYHH